MNETTIVELTGKPELIEEDDRIIVSVEGETMPHRTPVRVTLQPRGPGDFHPFAIGDRVSCVVMMGRLVGGVLPVGWYGDVEPPQSMSNRELRARAGGNLVLAPARDDSGSNVLIGRETRDGATYQQIMLFDRLRDEVVSLKAQINALATKVETMTATAGVATIGAGAVAAVANATLPGGITGGDPVSGARGAK